MRIVIEKNLTEEQIDKVYQSYGEEKLAEINWAHAHPLWDGVKSYVNSIRPDILKQLKAKIVNPNKLREELD